MRIARGIALMALVLVLPAASFAQEARTYGPIAKTFLTLGPFNFVGADSTVTYSTFSFGFGSVRGLVRTNASGNTFFVAPVNLPEGALVTEMEVVFCDTSPTKFFASGLQGFPRMASLGASFTGPSSDAAEQPGCVDRTVVFNSPLQIDNNNNVYEAFINLGGVGTAGDNTIAFGSMRLGYHLQVSPPPGTARFIDVPTSHPFFQFVEALAAAGITTGCNASPPMYCPDDPVSRGQIAVLLGKALGLQFAP